MRRVSPLLMTPYTSAQVILTAGNGINASIMKFWRYR